MQNNWQQNNQSSPNYYANLNNGHALGPQPMNFHGTLLPPIQPHPSCKKCRGAGQVKDKIGGMMPCSRCYSRNGYCKRCFGSGTYFKKFKPCTFCTQGKTFRNESGSSSDDQKCCSMW